jgi:hypothetical protein
MTNATLKWLNGWCAFMGLFGVLMMLAAYPPLDWPIRIFVDLAFWPLDGKPWPLGSDGKLLFGIGAGMLVGWMVVLAWLFKRGIEGGDPDALRVAQTSLWVWFAIDSLHSIAVGAWMNAVLNVAILAGFVVPLWRLQRATPSTVHRAV